MVFSREAGLLRTHLQLELDLEEAFDLALTRRVAHFAERFRFDLADAFAGDAELASDFFKGAAIAVAKAESELENFTLAVGQRVEDFAEFFFEQRVRRHVGRVVSALVFDEVAEIRVLAVADGGLE